MGDRHLDETLEELAIEALLLPPEILEDLVGFEVASTVEEPDALRQAWIFVDRLHREECAAPCPERQGVTHDPGGDPGWYPAPSPSRGRDLMEKSVDPSPEAPLLVGRQRRLVMAGILTGMFLAAFESTVVGTAMPTVIAALGGLEHYSWVFSAYLLTSTVSVPLWGKLSDLYGRRPLYLLSVAIFLVGSALSGFAGSMFQLIVWRSLQGLGAGGLIPITMTVVGDLYTPQERARMQGVFSGVWGVASIIGPLAGGFITDQLSWRWVFFVNVPFGIAAALVVGLTLREPPSTARPVIDYAGAATLTAGLTLVMLVLMGNDLPAPLASLTGRLALAIAGLVLLVIFITIEQRVPEPMIPLEILRHRVIAPAVGAGFFIGMAMFGVITYVPLFAQGVQNATATQAGSLLTPLMLSWVSLSIIGGRLLLVIGVRRTVVAGTILMLVGFAILSRATVTIERHILQIAMAIIGSGLGLSMLTLLIAVQHAVPRERRGVATSVNQFGRSVGGALGVTVLGALLTSRLTEVTNYPEQLASALREIFLACGGFVLAGLVVSLFLPGPEALAAAPLTEEECSPGTGERLVMAELSTLDADHEPDAAGDHSSQSTRIEGTRQIVETMPAENPTTSAKVK